MQYTHNYSQTSLFNFSTLGFRLEESRLVKIAEAIPWDKVMTSVMSLYSNKGRNANSARVMTGLEMGKTFFQVSDEVIVSMLSTDVGLMVLCGFDRPPTKKEIPSSNSMTDFRNRLTVKVLNEINAAVIQQESRKLPPRKRTQVTSDTSCVQAKITYPTDVKLLTKVYEHLVKIAMKTRSSSKELIIRGKRNIKKEINSFNKKRKHKKEEILKILNKLIEFNSDLYKKLKESSIEFTQKQKETLQKAKNIVEQQSTMLKSNVRTIQNRIVSFHEQKLRPIYRGKSPQATEFGKKASIIVVGQSLIIPNMCEYDNFSDSKVLEEDIKKFKEVTNRDIKEYSADRGFHSPQNHRILERENIIDGIAYKGAKPKSARDKLPKTTQVRLSNQRQPSEGKLGTLKTRYGCRQIPYKADNTEVRVGMACVIHNLNWGILNG